MLPEFVNAIITLNTQGSYELYSGNTPSGGKVVVSIESKRAEGYNSTYFKIKQFVIEPGQQAYVQKFDVGSLELVHKMILMSIEEGYHDNHKRDRAVTAGSGETPAENTNDSVHPTIPIVTAKSRPVNKIISSTPIRNEANATSTVSSGAFEGSEYPGGIDDQLEAFMGGGGIKIANMRIPAKQPLDEQEATRRRSSVESLLDSSF